VISKHFRLIATVLISVLAGLVVTTAVHAQTASEEAEALIRQANELRREKRDAAAFPLLQKAHAIASTPRTAAQLGMVEINLGYWLNAERHLSEALAAPRDPWIYQHRDKLAASLATAKAAIGEIGVSGEPAGAEVWVNGRLEGRLPLEKRIRAGEGPVQVELRAAGHATDRRNLTVTGGQSVDVVFRLVSASSPEPAITPPAPAADSSVAASAPASGGGWMRPAAWTTSAGAAGALGVALWQTLRWRDAKNEFEDHRGVAGSRLAGERDCGADEANHGGPGCDEIYGRLQTAQRWSIVGYAGAAALGAAAITLFVLDGRRSDRESRLSASCGPSPGLRGGLCTIAF
jgi:hypothetical protein